MTHTSFFHGDCVAAGYVPSFTSRNKTEEKRRQVAGTDSLPFSGSEEYGKLIQHAVSRVLTPCTNDPIALMHVLQVVGAVTGLDIVGHLRCALTTTLHRQLSTPPSPDLSLAAPTAAIWPTNIGTVTPIAPFPAFSATYDFCTPSNSPPCGRGSETFAQPGFQPWCRASTGGALSPEQVVCPQTTTNHLIGTDWVGSVPASDSSAAAMMSLGKRYAPSLNSSAASQDQINQALFSQESKPVCPMSSDNSPESITGQMTNRVDSQISQPLLSSAHVSTTDKAEMLPT